MKCTFYQHHTTTDTMKEIDGKWCKMKCNLVVLEAPLKNLINTMFVRFFIFKIIIKKVNYHSYFH